MNWTECVNENKEFTSKHDLAVGVLRRALGSFERMAQQVTVATGKPISGQSIRRWITSRAIPINYATTLIQLAHDKDENLELSKRELILSLYPYLEGYIDDEDYLA